MKLRIGSHLGGPPIIENALEKRNGAIVSAFLKQAQALCIGVFRRVVPDAPGAGARRQRNRCKQQYDRKKRTQGPGHNQRREYVPREQGKRAKRAGKEKSENMYLRLPFLFLPSGAQRTAAFRPAPTAAAAPHRPDT